MKPLIVALNLDEEDIPREAELLRPFQPWLEAAGSAVIALSARLECEIRQLPDEDARRFLQDFGIERPARAKLIATAYGLMGPISFFTVGPDEVKAWTIRAGTPAVRAAGVIHSDIERGFIRAEVVAYEDFAGKGNMPGLQGRRIAAAGGEGTTPSATATSSTSASPSDLPAGDGRSIPDLRLGPPARKIRIHPVEDSTFFWNRRVLRWHKAQARASAASSSRTWS